MFTVKKASLVDLIFLVTSPRLYLSQKRNRYDNRGNFERDNRNAGFLQPYYIEGMSRIRLMNRTDTKYLLPLDTLAVLLKRAACDYHVQEVAGERASNALAKLKSHN